MGIGQSIRTAGLAALLAVMLTGCASYTAKNGDVYVIGFARIHNAESQDSVVRQITRAGVYVDTAPDMKGAGIGWESRVWVLPPNDALTEVDFDTTDPDASRVKVTRYLPDGSEATTPK